MKVALYTQVYENYGAHEWDGTGECPQYWKAKGGENYVISNLSIEEAISFPHTKLAATLARIEIRDNYFQETVIDWEILDDDAHVGDEWDTPIELQRFFPPTH